MSTGSLMQWGRAVAYLPWLAGFTALWALMEAIGYGISRHYHFAQIVGLRYSVHLLVLLAVCAPFGLRTVAATRRPLLQIARGVCMFVMPATFVVAISSTPGRNLWSMFWIMPVIVAGAAYFFLRERVSRSLWLLLLCGYLGALLMLRPDTRLFSVADLWAVLGAISFAGYVVLSRELRAERLAPSLFYTGATVLVITAPFMAAVWKPIETADIWMIAAIGVCSLLALSCIDRALDLASASVVAPFLYAVVGWEVVLDTLVTRQWPSWVVIGGGAMTLVVAAIAAINNATGRAHE